MTTKGHPVTREEYEIKASNGHVYRMTGTAEQAKRMGAWIEQRIAAGDHSLSDTSTVPDNGRVIQPAKQKVDRGGLLKSVDAGARSIARGFTSNFMDELSARANAVLPIDKIFNPNVKSVWDGNTSWDEAVSNNERIARGIDAADDEQHPVISGVGKITGSVAQALTAAKAFKAAAPALLPKAAIGPTAAIEAYNMAHPVKAALIAGTVGGGTSGALSGVGEGTDTQSRIQNAKTGGAISAMAGGVLAPAITSLGPAISRYGAVLFGKMPYKEAMLQLKKTLANDGFDVSSPSGVKALKDELSRYLGKPVSLADVGHATRARAGVGLRTPSAAQSQSIDKVLERQSGQGARLAGDIRATVAPRTDVHALDEALVKQREELAMPLREKALFTGGPGYGNTPAPPTGPLAQPTGLATGDAEDAGLRRVLGLNVPEAQPTFTALPAPTAEATDVARQARIPQDAQLQQLARLPFAQRALKASRNLAQEEVRLRSVLGQDISHLPDVSARGADLDMRSLDYLKRFLDTEVRSLARGAPTNTFKAAEYAQVRDMRNAIRERMKQVVPEYGDYLDAYRGPSEMLDALHSGRDFAKLDPEQIAAAQGKRSEAGQELYRVGVARSLIDDVTSARDGTSPARNLLHSDEARAQLAATGVSPDDLASLNARVGAERNLSLLPEELRGSQQARRITAASDADAGVHAALPFNPGSSVGWLGAGIRSLLNRANITRNAGVNEQLLPRILETDPAAIDKTIQELISIGEHQKAAELQRLWVATVTSSTVGSAIGRGTARSNPEE